VHFVRWQGAHSAVSTLASHCASVTDERSRMQTSRLIVMRDQFARLRVDLIEPDKRPAIDNVASTDPKPSPPENTMSSIYRCHLANEDRRRAIADPEIQARSEPGAQPSAEQAPQGNDHRSGEEH
jgi:hypothetical protein